MRTVYRGIGVLFLVVGLLQLTTCLIESSSAVASNSWPTTKGVVVSSEVMLVKGGKGTGHVPTVNYRYEVNGVPHLGKRIHIRDVSEMPDEAEISIASFPVGKEVDVHFDPNEPAQAVLRPGLYRYSFMWLALSVAGMLVGIAITYFYRPDAGIRDAA